jgi:hypothetical protein
VDLDLDLGSVCLKPDLCQLLYSDRTSNAVCGQRDDMTVKINRGEDSVKLWFLTEMVEDATTGLVLRSG